MICTILQYAQYYNMHNMQVVAETSSTVDRLTGAQPKILSRVGKLPKSARDHNRCTFLKTVFLWEWMHFCDYYVVWQCLKKEKSSGNNSSLHETTNGLAHFQKPFRRFYNLICKP